MGQAELVEIVGMRFTCGQIFSRCVTGIGLKLFDHVRLIIVPTLICEGSKRSVRILFEQMQCTLKPYCPGELFRIDPGMFREYPAKLFGAQTGCISQSRDITFTRFNQSYGCIYPLQVM